MFTAGIEEKESLDPEQWEAGDCYLTVEMAQKHTIKQQQILKSYAYLTTI